MNGIFVSYRRGDAAGHAGRLYDRLAAQFGPDQVFRDLDSLSYGTEFLQAIRESISTCGALVAVIGRQWLTVARTDGVRRLDDPRDFVRLEIASALERGIPIIPVLVEGAEMPSEADLPVPLVRLSHYNALEVSDSRWDFDVGRLVAALDRCTAAAPAATGPPTLPDALSEPRTAVLEVPHRDPALPPPEPTPPAPSPEPVPAPPPPASPSDDVAPSRSRHRLPWTVVVAGLLGLLGVSAAVLFAGGDDAGPGAPSTTAPAPESGRGGGGAPTPFTESHTVSVAGTEAWTDTGIDLRAGDHVVVSATGTVRHDGSQSRASAVDADGSDDPDLQQYNVVPRAGHSGLIGRIGEGGTPFHLGRAATATVTAPTHGRLYLGVNDTSVDDNSGEFSVTMDVVGER